MSYHLRRYKNSRYWYARITRPSGARGNWLSTRKVRKQDARLVAEHWDAAATTNDRVLPLSEAFRLLAAHMERKKRSDATMEILSLKASHVCTFFGEQRDIRTLELEDTERYLDHRRAKGTSDATVAKELGYLMAALKRCRKLKLYRGDEEELWPDALPKQFKSQRRRWLPWGEYLRVLEHILPQWRDQLIVYTSTGVRFQELLRIRASDVAGGFLAVRGSKTPGAVRRVPLSAEAMEALQRRKDATVDGQLFPLSSPDIGSQKRAWLRALSKACKRALVAHASTNDLRRTFCSWGRHRGVSKDVMRGWMGHHSNRMIDEVYAQPDDAHEQSEMAKMPTRWLTPMSPQTGPLQPN